MKSIDITFESIPLIIIFILFLCACKEVRTEKYMKDKEHIEKAFISNEEIWKRFLNYYEVGNRPSYKKVASSDSIYPYSYYNFGYAAYKNKENYTVATKVPVGSYIDVEVGHISYSRDSLKCVALITVGDYRESELENNEPVYNGYAFFGIRDCKNEDFKIYPMNVFGVWHFPSKSEALSVLKLTYIYKLSGSSPNFAPRKYSCGINNPKFFETAPEFVWVDSLNLYWGQCEASYRKLTPYVFYSNQDSTIHKYIGLAE